MLKEVKPKDTVEPEAGREGMADGSDIFHGQSEDGDPPQLHLNCPG